MSFLMTGASGFIGSNLLRRINTLNKDVYLLSAHKIDGYNNINYANYELDINDFKESPINTIDVLLLLGAFTPKKATDANLHKNIDNITTIRDLLEKLPILPKKIIYISTIDVYSNFNQTINEQTETNPPTIYGLSKLFCENYLKVWTKEKNIELQILRLGHIYGRGEDSYKKLIPITINNLINGIAPTIITNGRERRAFLHINDCCDAIISSIYADKIKEKVINIVSKKSYSVLDIVNMLTKISNFDQMPIIKNERIQTNDFIFDNSMMEKYLTTEKVTLYEGLQDEYDYFRTKK